MPAQALSPERQRRWPPIVVALALQLLGVALVAGAAYVLAPRGIVLRPMVAALLTGISAASLSRLARLDVWWTWIQLCFAPAVLLASLASLPRWIWIAMFVALAAVYWSTFRTQVPLYLSSAKVREALVPLLPPGRFTFIDLGSGVGGVLTYLSQQRTDGEFHGVESAPVPWLVSWARIRLGRHTSCHVRWGSFWNADLSEYDVVFAYLSPVPMRALWEKVQRELKPGSRFISNTFVVDAHPPDMTVPVDDLHKSVLYVWTRPLGSDA